MIVLVTWNLWFSPHRQAERTAMLLEELGAASADVVCLQEVTPEIVAVLRQAPTLAGYTLLDDSFDPEQLYGTVILSRVPVRSWERRPLPSTMGRDLHLATLGPPGCPELTVGTVHLESRRWNGDVRAEQLEVALSTLRSISQDAVLAGDFNFDDGWPEASRLKAFPDFTDLWLALGREGPGFTVDTRRNAMTAQSKGVEKQTRYDRVLLRSQGGAWGGRRVHLLGTTPHAQEEALHASDHFGLRVELESRS
ncbi:MAG: endonuclease/exonuclease/phosphatase family protein [Polyangiaceae bacterium]|jgi:tyrosyl-DNA phosphodiesterase 2|nr:endonuclease/exonuclease/phosphatase family protein [Polyangiaceae bacterium]